MIHEAPPQASLPITVSRRLPLAWATLAWERFWPAAWPALGVIGLFLVVALFDVLSSLPAWLHALVLLVFLAGFGYGAWYFHKRFVWPTRRAALRRMELESGFTHQPLSMLDSAFAGSIDDDVGLVLWHEHRRRVAAGLGPIRVGWPRRAVEASDPRKLRIALILLLMIAVLESGSDAGRRLAEAVTLRFGGMSTAVLPTTDLWITPPAYTGMAPIYLGGEALRHGVSVPEGSTMLVQIHAPGADGDLPQLSLPGQQDRGGKPAFTALDEQDFKASATLNQSGPLAITLDGTSLVSVDVSIIADKPPSVAFARPVSVTQHQALRIDYKAQDDYGVTGLRLQLWRVSPTGAALAGAPQTVDIAVPAPPSRNVDDTLFQDLTASLWAGLPVEMRLVAKDGAGQEGASAPVKLVLPERVFHNEVARLLVAWRKQLTVAPDSAPQIGKGLAELSTRPGFYRNDIAVFLGLRIAARDLLRGREPTAIADAQGLMWSMALKIEGGATAEAEKDLRAAQQALRDALAKGASPQEVDRLMRQLDATLDRYLRTMRAAQGNPSPQNTGQRGPNRTVSEADLKKLLAQAEEMARNGDKQGAQAALNKLQSILESLRMGGPNPAASAARQAMDKLGSIARQQQSLMDRGQQLQNRSRSPSFDGKGVGSAGRTPSPNNQAQGGRSQDSAGALGEAQQGLRQQLDALRRSMGGMLGQGDGSQALDQAGQSMDQATRALRQGQTGTALSAQADVLTAMRQAAQAMAQAMSQGGEQGSAATDPFGRDGTGSSYSDQGNMDLSNSSALQESRRILDELRRRAGEPDRPAIERDYIDRLLQDF